MNSQYWQKVADRHAQLAQDAPRMSDEQAKQMQLSAKAKQIMEAIENYEQMANK